MPFPRLPRHPRARRTAIAGALLLLIGLAFLASALRTTPAGADSTWRRGVAGAVQIVQRVMLWSDLPGNEPRFNLVFMDVLKEELTDAERRTLARVKDVARGVFEFSGLVTVAVLAIGYVLSARALR